MTEQLIARVHRARQAAADAAAAEEQAVRDAVAGGVTPTDVARHGLGTKNRQRVYAILAREAGTPRRPDLTPVVYLRGAGCDTATWENVEQAMWARGWSTVRERTTAWHPARGGVPVVLVDFSTDRDVNGRRVVEVGAVRARYETATVTAPLSNLLPTSEIVRITQQDPAASGLLHRLVATGSQEMDLPVVSGGFSEGPVADGRVDADALTQLVAQALDARGLRSDLRPV